MRKNKSKDLADKTNVLTAKELIEFKKLEETFGKKFGIINIEGNFVYGCSDNKRIYLGTKENYYEYRTLKHKKLSNGKSSSPNRFETYNNFNL